MIPKAHITAWRKIAPWPDDTLVEQDLVLSRALVTLFSHSLISTNLAFRGGTALNKLFMQPASRFSEDIDLVQISEGPIGVTMDAIRLCLEPWLESAGRKQGAGRVTMNFRYLSESEPKIRKKLKIEINTREHFSVYPLVMHPYEVLNPWFEGSCNISAYDINELLGTKMRALYQRKKGRDLFDLAKCLSLPSVEAEKIVQCFLFYMKQEQLQVTRAIFEANYRSKIQDPMFKNDIKPLLSVNTDWDFEKASQLIYNRLITKMPGDPWKGVL